MKIYYAAAIRGTHLTDNTYFHKRIIEHLHEHYVVLTEHLANGSIKEVGETHLTDKEIHDRDMAWVEEADVIIAEVSNPSLGVGYELGRALEIGKKILCLYSNGDKKLSAMIKGSAEMETREYNTSEEAIEIIDEFLHRVTKFGERARTIERINKNVVHDLITGKHDEKK